MFVILTEGSFSHSDPVGRGTPRLVRISDIETITERNQKWLGETVVRHVCSVVTLSSLRDFRGRTRPIEVRETVAQITAAIQAAMPRHTAMHDHAVFGTVALTGQATVAHEVFGAIEHVTLTRAAAIERA